MEVTLPDGSIAEFPDNMDQSQIESVLQRQFPVKRRLQKPINRQQTANGSPYGYPGVGGIASDIGESVLSAPGALAKSALNIPEHIQNIGQYRLEHGLAPTLGQTALGVPEFVSKLLSAPHIGARYIGSKFAPKSRFTRALQQTPTPFEFLQQGEGALGLSPTEKGSGEVRGLGELFAGGAGMKALESALARTGMITGQSTGGGGDPIHAALGAMLGEKLVSSLPSVPRRLREAQEPKQWDLADLESDVKSQQDIVDSLQKKYTTQNKLMKTKADLESELSDMVDPTKRLPNLGFEGQYENLQDLSNRSESALEEAHAAQGLQLGSGNELIPREDFETRAAPLVIEHVENIKRQIAPQYNAINQAAKDVNVVIPNHARAQEIQTQMEKLISDGMINPMNDAVYDSILQQLEKQWPGDSVQSIPAPQYINTYKATRDLANIARQRSRQEGIAQPERQRWEAQARQLEPMVKEQIKVLQNTLPDNLFNKLLATDRAWSEQVIPFYRNKIYQDVRQQGRAPANMIDKTAGVAPHQQIMQRAIQSNPELNRLAIGQQYAHRPHELLTPNERLRPYVESHAPTRNLLETQRRHHATHNRIQQNLASLESQRQFRALQQEGIAKQTREQIKAREKVIGDLSKTMKELEELNRDTRSLDEEIKKLGITKERFERKKEYDKRKSSLKRKLWDVTKTAMTYAIGGKVLDSAFKVLFKY